MRNKHARVNKVSEIAWKVFQVGIAACIGLMIGTYFATGSII